MSTKSRQWFRMWSEVVDDEKLRLLAFEDRWHFVAILACKAQGILDTNDNEQMLRRKIAVKLGLQVRELEEVARRLAEVGVICEDTLQPTSWDKRQFESDTSTERVRRFRERNDVKRSRNVSETPPETETETETEDTHASHESAKPAGSTRTKPPCPHEKILALWRDILPELPQPKGVEHWTDARKAQLRARWNDQLPDLDTWRQMMLDIRGSPFLMGQRQSPGRKPFRCDLFWITTPERLLRLQEGKYDG